MPVTRRKLQPAAPALPTTAVNSQSVPFPNQRLLRIPQAAHYLNRSVWMIRQMIASGELHTVGNRKPFVLDRNDLDVYIEKAKAA